MKHCNCKNNCNCNDNDLLKLIAIDIAKLKNIIDDILDSDRKVYWNSIINKPDVFPPEFHQHIIDNIIGLNDELNKKVNLTYLQTNYYDKDFIDDLNTDLNNKITSAISGEKGSISISDAAPTEDGIYRAAEEGTYPNLGGLVVESGKNVWFRKNGSVWTIYAEVDSSTPTGVIQQGSLGAISGDTVFQALDPYIIIPKKVNTQLYNGDGTFTESGNYRTSANYLSIRIVPISPIGGEEFYAEGFESSDNKLIRYYTDSDTLNQNPNNVAIPNGVTELSWVTPVGYTKMIFNVARGTNVGADVPNSPYQNSFTLIKGGEPRIKTSTIVDRINSEQLLTIENKIETLENKKTFAFFDGRGFPSTELGSDGDKYFDKSSKIIYIKTLGEWKPNPLYRQIPFKTPSDFTYNINYPIWAMDNGKFYIEWKGLFEEKVKQDYDRLPKYYVDRVNGNDSNNGLTPETAVKTINQAKNVLGARNIILKAGIYPLLEHWDMHVDSNVVYEPLIIRCLDGKAIMSPCYQGNTFTWVLNGEIWQTTRSGVLNVSDLTYLDKEGLPEHMIRATTLEQCRNTPGSWFLSGSTIYINTFDKRVPDLNVLLIFARNIGYTAGENVPYVYFENIDVYNQNSDNAFNIINNTIVQYNTKVYLKNCFTSANSTGNAIGIDNIKETILEGCGGSNVYRDALNYHTSLLNSGYTPMKVLEIDCFGYNTGVHYLGVYSSNGSTTHEGISILRINGDFWNGSGSVIADVNDGALSLNLGVEANESTIDAGFRINGNGSKAWYYNITSYSTNPSIVSIKVDPGASGYLDNKSFTPNGTTGNIINI